MFRACEPSLGSAIRVLIIRGRPSNNALMETLQSLGHVVDRLHDWFGIIPRPVVEQVLREETARYQQRLRAGDDVVNAEHAAFERLRDIVEPLAG